MLTSFLHSVAAGVSLAVQAIVTVIRIALDRDARRQRAAQRVATDKSQSIAPLDGRSPDSQVDATLGLGLYRLSIPKTTDRQRRNQLLQDLIDKGVLDHPAIDINWLFELSTQVDFPVTIYLADERPHDAVEAAVESALNAVGVTIEERDDPIIGSWFRRMRAKVGNFARSPLGKEIAATAIHAADSAISLKRDAEVAALLSQNIGPIITALQPTPDAILRLGPLLILKLNGVVVVHQLTAAQQLTLDHNPSLLTSPHEAVLALELSAQFPQQAMAGDNADNSITPQLSESTVLHRIDGSNRSRKAPEKPDHESQPSSSSDTDSTDGEQ